MKAAAKSECSYLVENPMNPSDALVEVQTFVAPFEDVDWGNLIADFQSEADKFVDGHLAAARKDDTTQDARCGLLLGVVASGYEVGRRRWVSVKSQFGVK
jgi:hypothetical protein